MKTFIFLLLITICSVQCSTQKFTSEEKALIEKYQIPEFGTLEITRFVLEYTKYYEAVIIAAKSGDENRIQALTSISVD